MRYLILFLLMMLLTSCVSKPQSGFYTKNDSLYFECGDVSSAIPFQDKKGTIFVDVRFTKQGLKKLCIFEKKHIGKEFIFKVNDNNITSKILIREAISCIDNTNSTAPMIFNNAKNVYLFQESVCKD